MARPVVSAELLRMMLPALMPNARYAPHGKKLKEL
jgi:hypothetical protein